VLKVLPAHLENLRSISALKRTMEDVLKEAKNNKGDNDA